MQCEKCRIESKQLFLCRQNEKEWYQCGDRNACDQLAQDAHVEEHRIVQEDRQTRFKAQYGNVGVNNFIRIGVLYKDATEYYYDPTSDCLFGKSFIDHEFQRRDKPISSYERTHIQRICGV